MERASQKQHSLVKRVKDGEDRCITAVSALKDCASRLPHPLEAGYGCPGSWDGGKCSLPSFFYGQKEVPDSVHDDSLSSFLFFLEIEVNFI